ncbi:GNAT family N-acetyltransferase [Actinoplanes sp. NPDC049802]|uniref:GNAT family N-acetyltransferase n=1 Tax=Actinoplanes sp. NPDC049802 TaxID=3154742 RepID=UPI0033C88218
MDISLGFTPDERTRVGGLYWEAFGAKLSCAFRDDGTGRAAVTAALSADRFLVARDGGDVLGVCGFRAAGTAAADWSWRAARSRLGWVAAVRATVVLAPLAGGDVPGVLVLDGLCVAAGRRGAGIGSALLTAALDLAAARGDRAVQLSVVDTNPRAEALYRRRGFVIVGQGEMGPLADVYGFRRHRTLRRSLEERPCQST